MFIVQWSLEACSRLRILSFRTRSRSRYLAKLRFFQIQYISIVSQHFILDSNLDVNKTNMMPISGEVAGEEFAEAHIDYKQKYKGLKKKLRLLVYEQECFLDELRKAQRKLLKVARDRSFLLDRLLQQEKVEDSSDESDATNSTDTEDVPHREVAPAKKRKLQSSAAADLAHMLTNSSKAGSSADSHPPKKKAKSSGKKSNKSSNPKPPVVKQESPGQMTREELERHLESKQHHEFGIEKATASLPMEIFSNDPNHDSDVGAEGEEEEDDLVIDVPH